MKTAPAVFAVGDNYQILVPVSEPSLMWVQVGDRCFYDDANGVLRSMTDVHRMTVPMALLNEAGAYTICERKIPERLPYCSKPKRTTKKTFPFYPVPEGSARAYHIADAHNRVAEPIRAAKTYGDFDFLIFNGDMPNHSGDTENFLSVFEIADALTGGTKPIVFTRGNHDLRGIYAEKYHEYAPNDNGNFYYTFRLGDIWGVVLDCGEDKNDNHVEYGHTICCHDFRLRETEFLKGLHPDDPTIRRRLVIAHVPFTRADKKPFDIEQPLYREWAEILKAQIRPDLMLCGHLHQIEIFPVGGKSDHLGQPCPVVIGAKPGDAYFAGAGILLGDNETVVTFTDSDGKILQSETL